MPLLAPGSKLTTAQSTAKLLCKYVKGDVPLLQDLLLPPACLWRKVSNLSMP